MVVYTARELGEGARGYRRGTIALKYTHLEKELHIPWWGKEIIGTSQIRSRNAFKMRRVAPTLMRQVIGATVLTPLERIVEMKGDLGAHAPHIVHEAYGDSGERNYIDISFRGGIAEKNAGISVCIAADGTLLSLEIPNASKVFSGDARRVLERAAQNTT